VWGVIRFWILAAFGRTASESSRTLAWLRPRPRSAHEEGWAGDSERMEEPGPLQVLFQGPAGALPRGTILPSKPLPRAADITDFQVSRRLPTGGPVRRPGVRRHTAVPAWPGLRIPRGCWGPAAPEGLPSLPSSVPKGAVGYHPRDRRRRKGFLRPPAPARGTCEILAGWKRVRARLRAGKPPGAQVFQIVQGSSGEIFSTSTIPFPLNRSR